MGRGKLQLAPNSYEAPLPRATHACEPQAQTMLFGMERLEPGWLWAYDGTRCSGAVAHRRYVEGVEFLGSTNPRM
ncbi:hypothetical protein Isop_0350 [Isosphaera pallida ATCC 43644]|uniref:Uncharacterized protein n=1 Tax=Isosphaera pallida (strain ATCC 43644 / DSM 9630 / IS1B) TaxID=575540 RepID=E8QXW6_ISOPI|nr:hypothetical protein Isop_0350 [Isosphaera pallida ATCC 43644]